MKTRLQALARFKFVLLTIFTVLLVAPITSKELHQLYLYRQVGSKVVRLLTLRGGGGTGFHVVAPSGKTFIVSNAHVCEGSEKTGMIALDQEGNRAYTKIIEISNKYDLCLLRPLEGMKGLTIAGEAAAGQKAYAVGHPSLMATTVSEGQVIESGMTLIPDHNPIESEADTATCLKYSPRKSVMSDQYGNLWCVQQQEAVQTNIQILPASSGSPVVDIFGRVVGVIFCGTDQVSWGGYVPVTHLKDFLSTR